MKKYRQGVYRPTHPEKCNSKVCIFRSSYELKFMRWVDNHPNVVSWSSEGTVIPYIKPSDGRMHRYFVDNTVTLKDSQGKLHKYLVEIKPYSALLPPKKTPRKRHNTLVKESITHAINLAKWDAAKKWASKKGYKFIILTEKELKINK
jgi:hypothetical protein